jgi:hypothetical protein
MRRLIADTYKVAYQITGYELASFFLALFYITSLNLLTIYGMSMLLTDLYSPLSYVHIAFMFPYILAPSLLMLAFNFWLMMPLEKLAEENGIKPVTTPIIIYTIASALLYAYTLLANHVV